MGTINIEGNPSPDLLEIDAPGLPIPAAFYSNQGDVLGRVRWSGIVGLDAIIDELNLQLQYYGSEIEGFDFRLAYDRWSYKYQIVENLGGQMIVRHEVRDGS